MKVLKAERKNYGIEVRLFIADHGHSRAGMEARAFMFQQWGDPTYQQNADAEREHLETELTASVRKSLSALGVPGSLGPQEK